MMTLFLILYGLAVDCNNTYQVKVSFHGINSEKKLIEFLNNYKNYKCMELEPYIASAIMQQARYAVSPFKKYQYFREGKKRLENFINSNPGTIEGRYVRYLIQKSIPSFLDYKSDMYSDQSYIRANIDKSQISDEYKKLILKNIKN